MSESVTTVTPERHAYKAEDLLVIPPGGTATTVYISVWADGTTLKPAFSLSTTGPAHKDGITWVRDPEFGLFLNCIFMVSQLGTILDIDVDPPATGLWYSKALLPAPSGGFNQQCCTQNVAGTYDFHVKIRNNNGTIFRVDPKIVVTPQTM